MKEFATSIIVIIDNYRVSINLTENPEKDFIDIINTIRIFGYKIFARSSFPSSLIAEKYTPIVKGFKIDKNLFFKRDDDDIISVSLLRIKGDKEFKGDKDDN